MARMIKRSVAGMLKSTKNFYDHYISPTGPSFL